MKKAVVVGGGFSGMVTAYFLAKKGFAVELHEAQTRLGGMISTERTPHGLAESAANGFILTEDLVELLSDLRIGSIQPLPAYRKKRFIYRRGLKRWPLTVFESLKLAMKFGFRWLFQRKSLTPKRNESVWDWGLRNLGFAASKYLLSPGLQGIYAGNSRAMSAALILGPMFQPKKTAASKGYRGTVSFRGGMQEFVEALARRLQELGVRIQLESNYRITSLQVPHAVCVSAAAAPEVLQVVAPEAARELVKAEMLPVLSITVYYEKAQEKLQGFGCLFPDDQGFSALGVLSPTYIFADRGPDYSETWIFGGTRSPKIFDRTDLEILAIIQTERKRIFASYSEFSEYRVYRWPKGLPHYTKEWAEVLDRVHLPKNLHLNGNYLGGIGLSKILTRSEELATKMDYEASRSDM